MLKVGDIIGGYKIEAKLGEGGMGVVFLAEQVSLQRKVALKLLPPKLADDEVYVQKFQREAKSAAKISHQNIVQVHDVGSDNGIHYLAMEYVDGESLKDMLETLGKISWQGTVDILKQSLAGIGRAHEANIIHRDIKPDNIMITSQAEIKVADFGLARAATEESSLTMEGLVVGTPYYMSPEQIESQILTGQTDIYSLGITIWHCLMGYPPFKGDTPMKTALLHLNKDLPNLRKELPDVPDKYIAIIEKMCQKEPKHRYHQAKDVLGAIADFEKDLFGNSIKKTSRKAHRSVSQESVASDLDEDLFKDLNIGVKKRHIVLILIAAIASFVLILWFFVPDQSKDDLQFKIDLILTDIKQEFKNPKIDEVSKALRRGYILDAEKSEAEGFIDQAIYLLQKANAIDETSSVKQKIRQLQKRKRVINK